MWELWSGIHDLTGRRRTQITESHVSYIGPLCCGRSQKFRNKQSLLVVQTPLFSLFNREDGLPRGIRVHNCRA